MSSDISEKARAVFLALVMITSVMVAGVAFTGSAAADAPPDSTTGSPGTLQVSLLNESTGTVNATWGVDTTSGTINVTNGSVTDQQVADIDPATESAKAIQFAIDNATAETSTVRVGPGTYNSSGAILIDEVLTLEGPNAGLAGDSDQRGAEATINGKINIGDQASNTLSGEVVIDGIEIATTDSGVTDGVVSVGDRKQVVENATIKNSVIDIDLSRSSVGVGIYTETDDNLTIENNAFTESGSGLSVAYNAAEAPVNTIEISENTLTDVDRMYNEGAGFIEGRGITSTTVRLVDNDVIGAGTAIGIGDSEDTLTSVDYIIKRNQIDASSTSVLV